MSAPPRPGTPLIMSLGFCGSWVVPNYIPGRRQALKRLTCLARKLNLETGLFNEALSAESNLLRRRLLNPLNPYSDQHLIPPNNITPES